MQKDALTLKFSVWRVLSARGLGTVNILPEGEGEGRVLPYCLKATIRAAFGCLTVNYGHIIFFLVIFEYTCGWKSAFLVNKRFIYYSPKSSIYYEDFFYVDHFELLAIKSMKREAVVSSPSSCATLHQCSL